MDNRAPGQSLVAASHVLRNAAGVCLVLFLVLSFFPLSGELLGILTVALLLVAAVCRLAAWGLQLARHG